MYLIVNGKANNQSNGPSGEIFTKLYNLKNGIEAGVEYDNIPSHLKSGSIQPDNNDDSVDVSNLISQFRLATSNS